jgi:adenylate cyclase
MPSKEGLIARLGRIGSDPADPPEVALQKRTLVLTAVLMVVLSTIWVVIYAWLGLYLSAAIPFLYQMIEVINLAVFARTRRYRFFRACELAQSLILPFALQLSLGGFVASSGVVLWSFTAPVGALLFSGRRSAMRWLVAFFIVVVIAGALDPYLVDHAEQIPYALRLAFFCMNILAVTCSTYLLMRYFVSELDRAKNELAHERERSEQLLRNVLPVSIAERLKAGESVIADGTSDAGVLFADIVGFTPLTATMEPDAIVKLLNEVFSEFDALAEKHGLEKIKTIGDAYMVASGLLDSGPKHAERLGEMALDMLDVVRKYPPLALRIGVDVGPVVAGVIGRRKFIYDLWGDTVNTASRMESHGVSGSIQVTERARQRMDGHFAFEDRGIIDVKGKGPMQAYLLTAKNA